MDAKSWSSDATLRLQSLQPQFRWQVTAGFLSVIFILGLASFSEHGVQSVYYGTLSAAGAVALIVQYRRERALVRDRLVEVGIVTECRKRLRSRSRFFDFILSRFTPDVSRIKYSFIAFDQKTYGASGDCTKAREWQVSTTQETPPQIIRLPVSSSIPSDSLKSIRHSVTASA